MQLVSRRDLTCSGILFVCRLNPSFLTGQNERHVQKEFRHSRRVCAAAICSRVEPIEKLIFFIAAKVQSTPIVYCAVEYMLTDLGSRKPNAKFLPWNALSSVLCRTMACYNIYVSVVRSTYIFRGKERSFFFSSNLPLHNSPL